jgi:hypothetical protein
LEVIILPVNNSPHGNFPFLVNMDENSDVKLTEDTYEVYVNNQLVGHKTLKTQGEQLSDIDDFLRQQNINEFSTSLDGDHYKIQTEGHDQDISDALSIYFNNR